MRADVVLMVGVWGQHLTRKKIKHGTDDFDWISIGIVLFVVKEIDGYFINKKVLKMKEEQLIGLICSSKQDPFLEDKVYLLWESIKTKKISNATRVEFSNFDSLKEERRKIKNKILQEKIKKQQEKENKIKEKINGLVLEPIKYGTKKLYGEFNGSLKRELRNNYDVKHGNLKLFEKEMLFDGKDGFDQKFAYKNIVYIRVAEDNILEFKLETGKIFRFISGDPDPVDLNKHIKICLAIIQKLM